MVSAHFRVFGRIHKIESGLAGEPQSAAMKSTIKTQKTYNLFPRLYGRAAYEAWKAREAEIDGLAKSGQYSVSSICHLREDNYRHMKLGKAGIVSSKALRPQRLAA